MSKAIAIAVLFVAISATLTGCRWPWESSATTTTAAEEAINAIKHDLNGSDETQLGDDIGNLDGLSSSEFSGGDLHLRSTLLTQAATEVLNNWADNWVKSTENNLATNAQQDASNDTTNATDSFKEALSNVTEDAIRGQTCKDILNLVAPNPNPTATSEPDDKEWQGDIEQDAADVLAKTFNLTGVDEVMEWTEWSNDVTSAAQQAADSITTTPVPYINLLSNPAGRRATAIYVRYCYAPPTTE